MQLNFGLFLLLMGCTVVFVKGQGGSANCGEGQHGEMTVEECETEFDGLGACLEPGNCGNEECQKKCYLCMCDEKVQCKVTGSGANEEVVCDCSLGTSRNQPGKGYGPYCQNECDSTGGCTGEHEVCDLETYTCVCDVGYERDADGNCIQSTVPVDECAEGTDECDDNAECTDTLEGYTCECNEGWEGDGFTCTDVNECNDPANANGGCGVNAVCINTMGSFQCVCIHPGYFWDGSKCADVDECATNNGNCNNARCINTEGSHVCMCPCSMSWNGAFCITPCGGTGGDGSCGGPACYPLFPLAFTCTLCEDGIDGCMRVRDREYTATASVNLNLSGELEKDIHGELSCILYILPIYYSSMCRKQNVHCFKNNHESGSYRFSRHCDTYSSMTSYQ